MLFWWGRRNLFPHTATSDATYAHYSGAVPFTWGFNDCRQYWELQTAWMCKLNFSRQLMESSPPEPLHLSAPSHRSTRRSTYTMLAESRRLWIRCKRDNWSRRHTKHHMGRAARPLSTPQSETRGNWIPRSTSSSRTRNGIPASSGVVPALPWIWASIHLFLHSYTRCWFTRKPHTELAIANLPNQNR